VAAVVVGVVVAGMVVPATAAIAGKTTAAIVKT